eukprot:TRINITY_DN52639_c0_g1_i1.p1 TRINITY_DN52639_c0_g1~~TRINITY_DN52639_c0_g1_i1.p1  ORF type:complete len:358 (-),score=71.30 TRINITY_DN52639_c0_g1_i1:7-1080(-)
MQHDLQAVNHLSSASAKNLDHLPGYPECSVPEQQRRMPDNRSYGCRKLWSMGDGFHGMLCRFHFEDGFRELCRNLLKRPAAEDEVLRQLLELEPHFRGILDMKEQVLLGNFSLLQALWSYATQAPPRRTELADLAHPELQSSSMKFVLQESLLIDQLLKCLPFWTFLHCKHPICWCFDTQCFMGLDVLYRDDDWEYSLVEDGVTVASVRHKRRGVSALWSNDLRVLHESSFEFARTRRDMLVVRILRATSADLQEKAFLQWVSKAECPPNCLSLWIRAESMLTMEESLQQIPRSIGRITLPASCRGSEDLWLCSGCVKEKSCRVFPRPDCLKKGVQALRCYQCMEQAGAFADLPEED